MEANLAYFCFGYACALSTVLFWSWMARREQSRDRSQLRGRAYWDAILEEDRRRQAQGKRDIEFP